MPVYAYDPPDRFVAGTVGQPGQRAFYLQATASGRTTSVALEKGQVSQRAARNSTSESASIHWIACRRASSSPKVLRCLA